MSGESFFFTRPLPTPQGVTDRSAAARPVEPAGRQYGRYGYFGRDHDAVPFPEGGPGVSECLCGRVCVCAVPVNVVRSVASFVAEWHPTSVVDGDPAASRAEDATVCRCGQAFCGYRILARTMRRSGAFTRA
jgi:hypothetical protein